MSIREEDPAEKVKPEIEPFKTLPEWFKKLFNESDVVIFIGFAFRDQYLNKIIMESPLSKRKKLIVVSPHASKLVDKFKEFSGTTAFIDRTFGEDGDIPDKIAAEID